MAVEFQRAVAGQPAAVVVADARWTDAGQPLPSGIDTEGVVSCSLADVQQWLGEPASHGWARIPRMAARLREAGAGAVCVPGIEGPDGRALLWLESHHARGWLSPRGGQGRAHPNAAMFASQLAAALRRGFVTADAAVIATMACSGGGEDFIHDPALLPLLSWDEAPCFVEAAPLTARPLGLYPIVDSAARVEQVLAAGANTVQLRIKTPERPDALWHAMLRREVRRSIAACRATGAELFVNDHWQLAVELGAGGAHLGQEDLVALGEEGRSAVLASGLALGVSSHSLWELCRACALAPRYIACGPVWPTPTKDMPWLPQGLDNLAWWCRMARSPVVAIGGVLGPDQVKEAARCGADGICLVRGLGDEPQQLVPALRAALAAGRAEYALRKPEFAWPHPSLKGNA